MKQYYSKFILSLGLLLLILGFSACGESPKGTAEKAAKAIQADDWHTFYGLISSEDQKLKNEDEVRKLLRGDGYQAEVPTTFPEAIKELKVKDFKATVNNDTAKVTYTREVLDLDAVTKAAFDFNDFMEMGGKKVTSLSSLPDNMKEKIGAYLRSNDVPKKDEKEKMILIKEEGKWKVFCNFAFPQRLKEAQAEVKKYLTQFDYDGARRYIFNFNQRYDVEEMQEQLDEIDKWKDKVAAIGQSVTIGSLEFTPLAVEIKKVSFTGNTYSGDVTQTESSLPYMVLQYRVKNVSKAQTFAPRDVPYGGDRNYTWVVDSAKNRMTVANSSGNANGNIDQEISKALSSGQEVVYHAVVSTPVKEDAAAYLWAVRLRVNNASDAFEDIFYARILKKDLPF